MIADTFEVGNLLQIFTDFIPTSVFKFEVLKINYFYLPK